MTKRQGKPASRAAPQPLDETELASDRMGNNRLQGDDQGNVHNERRAVADVRQDTDGVIESFEKLDKDKRARTDLGKGARSGDSGSGFGGRRDKS